MHGLEIIEVEWHVRRGKQELGCPYRGYMLIYPLQLRPVLNAEIIYDAPCPRIAGHLIDAGKISRFQPFLPYIGSNHAIGLGISLKYISESPVKLFSKRLAISFDGELKIIEADSQPVVVHILANTSALYRSNPLDPICYDYSRKPIRGNIHSEHLLENHERLRLHRVIRERVCSKVIIARGDEEGL